MKKIVIIFAALALALCSCISFQSSFQNNDDIKIGGEVQVNDRNSYFIIVGGESKSAKTYFLVKDSKNVDAWKTVVSSVGRTVFIHGKVVEDASLWVKTVAVTSVSFPEP
ncbi:MAG: hypothetical protein IK094_03680 [Treponema sp.]|nr:hypothetical protein [Treponema sp.]